MKCATAAPYLAAAAGEIDPATASALAEHVATCRSCRAETSQYERLRDALAAVAAREPDPPPDLFPAIVARTSGSRRRNAMPMMPLPSVEIVRMLQENREAIMGAAGVLLVAAGSAWVLWKGLRSLARPAPQRA